MIEYDAKNQLKIEGFETPFYNTLNKSNRWVKLAQLIPWDEIVAIYIKKMNPKMGRKSLNPRLVVGAMIIKHMEALSDRATVEHITENVYMQYFCGFDSMINKAPFDASMFVHFRKRLGHKEFDEFSQLIVNKAFGNPDSDDTTPTQLDKNDDGAAPGKEETNKTESIDGDDSNTKHKGILKIDATVINQDITFPTDLKLLNASRLKAEEIIDELFYGGCFTSKKPRTYCKKAKSVFLRVVKKKTKGDKTIRKAIRQQLQFLRRDLKIINQLLDEKPWLLTILSRHQYKYLLVIQEVYRQQQEMYKENKRSTPNRIVNIHQPHVRPILRGKDKARTEFGAKVNASTINGYTFIDQMGWENFNESTFLQEQVENYLARFKCLPRYVLADRIYLTRANRAFLKALGIKITGKPLGRPPKKPKTPSKDEQAIHNQRNHIEGKFGQVKRARHLHLNLAKLAETAFSWTATSFFVTNLLTLMKQFCSFLLSLFVQRHRQAQGFLLETKKMLAVEKLLFKLSSENMIHSRVVS